MRRAKRPSFAALGWVVAIVLVAVVAYSWRTGRREHSQDRTIQAAARRYGVDPALVKAVVWRESDFDPRARGRAGEIGLMQITDAAAQEWAEAERVYPLAESKLFDPRTNIHAGAWYLRKLLQRYQRTDQPAVFALADYNAGRGNVLKWAKGPAATNSEVFVGAIGFPATQAYVRAVLERRSRYVADFTGAPR